MRKKARGHVRNISEECMFGWFDAARAKSFGKELALLVAQRFPLEDAKASAKHLRKREQVLRAMESKIRDFKSTERLNVYKTAQLCNAFKWQLKDSNFPDEFVDTLMGWLTPKL